MIQAYYKVRSHFAYSIIFSLRCIVIIYPSTNIPKYEPQTGPIVVVIEIEIEIETLRLSLSAYTGHKLRHLWYTNRDITR